jgi:hypothetical protein
LVDELRILILPEPWQEGPARNHSWRHLKTI